MTTLIEFLGLKGNPFASYVAENEPEIEYYFIRPQYYSTVLDRGNNSQSLILFGARGAGKSATRLAYYKNAIASRMSNKSTPLVIILDDFSRILDKGLNKVDLGSFVSEIGYLVVESILLWLAELSEDERKIYLEVLNKEEEANAIELVKNYYLILPELVRNSTISEPLKLLDQAWYKRGGVWVSSRWNDIVKIIANIAQGITKKQTEIDVDIAQPLSDLLKRGSSEWNNAVYARAILLKFVRFARTFGFTGVTVLVDKADETTVTNNSAVSTASLLYPILSSTQLLEVEGFGWLFFLWDLLEKPYSSDQKIRLDKIANAFIKWEDNYLRELIEKRLRYFSDGKIQEFSQLCQTSVNTNSILNHIIRLSMKSPRELIRIMDTIIREHDDEYNNSLEPTLLTTETINRALDKYTVDTIRRVFERKHLQQIKRLSKVNFINRDVQLTFRINDDTARNRIIVWTDAGIVAQTGTRAAEGGSGGKPAHEYSIVDQRVKRVIERNLSLGSDFEQDEFTDQLTA
ncbi:hypothetical protein F8S13_12200 [Chloroflexia bacterium SDU3-3]|nr:hypothetical protein F8S13_12200 [Chloroflexia bacterium SDU3-3]